MAKSRSVKQEVPNPYYPDETSSGLPVGTQTIYRPRRKVTRTFQPCDVARIARQCASDNGYPAEMVLAYVARALGFTHIALHRHDTNAAADERRSGDSALLRQLEEIRDRLDEFLRKSMGLDV